MRKHVIETVMGAVVLLVAGLFVYFAAVTAEIRAAPGYPVTASFAKIGGLGKGSDVRISGVKVGSVTDFRLDPQTFEAVVTMSIAHDIRLPDDSVAVVGSDGLLAGKYVRLEPGRSRIYVAAGGIIRQTRAYKSLEDQVGEIIFLATSPPEKPAAAPPAKPGEQ
jgi:phospholipid/cholesterol/gamma-HCH transport system substrate-binding protein